MLRSRKDTLSAVKIARISGVTRLLTVERGKKVGGWSADGNQPTTTRTVIGAGESESAAGRDGFSGA